MSTYEQRCQAIADLERKHREAFARMCAADDLYQERMRLISQAFAAWADAAAKSWRDLADDIRRMP